jgi:hypothetical protein
METLRCGAAEAVPRYEACFGLEPLTIEKVDAAMKRRSTVTG